MLTKDVIRAVRVDMDAALRAVGIKHGMNLTCGNSTFYPADGRFNMKINGTTAGAVDPSVASYNRNMGLYNLPKRGTTFVFRKRVYAICGLSPRGKIIASRSGDGKKFSFLMGTVKQLLGIDYHRSV